MNGEDIDRAIEFLLQGQAKHEAWIEELRQQNAETNRIVQLNADNLNALIRIVTQNMEAQAEINASSRAQTRELTSAQTQNIEAQAEINASLRAQTRELTSALLRADERGNKTDERLDRITALLERHVSEAHGES